jgi:hypothetical protein
MSDMKVDSEKYGVWIQKAFDLYKANFVTLFVVSLVAGVLSSVTVGILSGPLFAGVCLISLGLLRKCEPVPQIGDMFKGFEVFLPSFLLVLVWVAISLGASLFLAFIPLLGQLATMVVSIFVNTVVGFGIILIIDRKMDFWPASMAVIEKIKAQPLNFMLISLIASLIGSAGLLLCCVGILVTAPMHMLILCAAYEDLFGEAQQIPVATYEPPPVKDEGEEVMPPEVDMPPPGI